MNTSTTSQKWPISSSIPVFGLFSFIVVYLFSLAFLNSVSPEIRNNLPLQTGELNGQQIVSLLSINAGIAAALAGMHFWGLLIVLPWKWLQAQHWSMTALFGGLVGLIEIVCTSALMWIGFTIILIAITQPPIATAIQVLALLPISSVGLGIFTLAIVAVASKGTVFLVGIAAGTVFALLARRLFS